MTGSEHRNVGRTGYAGANAPRREQAASDACTTCRIAGDRAVSYFAQKAVTADLALVAGMAMGADRICDCDPPLIRVQLASVFAT